MKEYERPLVVGAEELAEGVFTASGNTAGIGTNVSWTLKEPDNPEHDGRPHWIRKYALQIPETLSGQTLHGRFVAQGPLRHFGCHHEIEETVSFNKVDTVEFDVKFSTGHTYYIWACCEPEDYPGALTLLSGELIPK